MWDDSLACFSLKFQNSGTHLAVGGKGALCSINMRATYLRQIACFPLEITHCDAKSIENEKLYSKALLTVFPYTMCEPEVN
jgi:hypothetical protein